MYNVRTGRETRNFGYISLLKSAAAAVNFSCAFSPDGTRIAFCGGNPNLGTISLWDAEAGTKLSDLPGHTSAVIAVAFSPDGQRLGSASHDNTARIWSVV
jgi:WD40 repeat protein